MTARMWTRAEIVALIESAEVHVASVNGEHTGLHVPPEAPKGGAGTTSAAECTCPEYVWLYSVHGVRRILGRSYDPACPIHGANRPGQGMVSPVNEVTREELAEPAADADMFGPVPTPEEKADHIAGLKPFPPPYHDGQDADDEAMRIAMRNYADSSREREAARIRAFGQAERERALREAVEAAEWGAEAGFSVTAIVTRLRLMLAVGAGRASLKDGEK